MTAVLVIREDGVERPMAAADFPLAIGGADAGVEPAAAASGPVVAYLGLERDELFVQPAAEGGKVFCNGSPVKSSQWLRDGDVVRVGRLELALHQRGDELRLEVERRSREAKTDPPRIAAVVQPPTARPAEDLLQPVEFNPARLRSSRRRGRVLRPRVIAVWAVLGVLLFVAWFLFSARTVEISVEPPPERLVVEGSPLQVEIGGRHLLRPGTYTVIAERAGYRRLERSLEVSDETRQTHTFRLVKLPGRLIVRTRPEEGAEIFVDGEPAARTPAAAIDLEEGEHEVRIRAERYQEFVTRLVVDGAGTEHLLEVELTPLWADIEIDSRPAGATVTVDGRVLGRTPLTAPILAGDHRLELRLEGYKPHFSPLEVAANRPRSLPTVLLAPLDGRLVLDSEPVGATVTVDDEFRGTTPLTLDLAPDRGHAIEVSKAGHESARRTVEVPSGATRELEITLQPQFGELELVGQPADAEVVVDGESRGRVGQTLRLTAVPHQIEVRKEGFESFRRTVTPRPGFPQLIEVELKTPAEIEGAAIRVVIRGPQGQEMRRIEPGSFRMGASRREPGRRANETLRQVELTRAFYLSTQEVSNRQFREYRPQHRSGTAGDVTLELDDQPVVRVTWEEAAGYCNWLSDRESLPPAYELRNGRLVGVRPLATGYRLPTEAEWAWAARYAGRREGLKYPWGQSLPVAPASGNYADASASGLLEEILTGYDDRFSATAPVDSFAPNAVGLFNMGGNVAEWVHDVYSIYPSAAGGIERDPIGPEEGELHVIRGSSWMDATVTELRLSYRDYGNRARPDVGFRIARFADD